MSKTLRRGLLVLTLLAGARLLAGTFGEPLVTLMPTSLRFPNQHQGTTSQPLKVMLSNSGGGDLLITGMNISGINGTDFLQTNDCPTAPSPVPAGGSCTIQVVFKPTGLGAETGTLSISDNASGSPQNVELGGTSTPPAPAVRISPTSLNFGNQAIATASAAQIITLSNAGSAILSITGNIVITGENAAEFTLVAVKTTCPVTGGQLPANASCAIAVSFAPATEGAKTAQVTIVDDAEGSPQGVPLAGVGTPK